MFTGPFSSFNWCFESLKTRRFRSVFDKENEKRANSLFNCMRLLGVVISLIALGSFGGKSALHRQGWRLTFSRACTGSGSHTNGLTYQYSESGGDVTLTISAGSNGASSVPSVGSGEHWRQDETCFGSVTKLVLTGVTAVGANSFSNMEKLKTIDAQALEAIGEAAFAGAISLAEITMPNWRTIGPKAFQNTVSLEIDLSLTTVTSNGESSFEGSGIRTITAKSNSKFATAAFRNCRNLVSYTFQSIGSGGLTVSQTPASVFEGCTSLTSFSAVNWRSRVLARAFYGCSSMENFLWDGCTSFEESVFEDCGFRTLDMTNSQGSTWGIALFRNCLKLETIKFDDNGPNGMGTLSESAFEGCTALTTLTYLRYPSSGTENNMRFIAKRAFYGCSKLSVFEALRSQTESIGDSAFEGTALTTFDLSICTTLTLGKSVFKNCQQLQSCTLHDSMTAIPEATFDGCVKLETVTHTNPITSFGARALCGCSLFTDSTIIDATTTEIGSSAFEGTAFTSIDLSSLSLASNLLENSAFKNCKDLSDCTMPESLASLSESVFEGCSSLVSIIIPPSVSAIGADCFRNCVKLVTVTYMGDSQITNCLFDGCTSLSGIEVKDGYPYKEFGCVSLDGKPVDPPDSSDTDSGSGSSGSNSGSDSSDNTGKLDRPPKGLSDGAIAAIVIVVLLVVAGIVVLLIFFLVIRKRRDERSKESVENTIETAHSEA